MAEDNKKSNATSVGKKITGALWWVLVILLAIILINVLGAKMRGEVPNIAGYSVLKIVSGSMGDEIPVGTYILVKSSSSDEVSEDDIICFYSTDPDIYGYPNTHRVVEPPIKNPDGSYEFVTKGDANPEADKYNAKGENLIGIYVKNLDLLTAFSQSLEGSGMIIVMVVLQIALLTMLAYTLFRRKNESSDDASDTPKEDAEK